MAVVFELGQSMLRHVLAAFGVLLILIGIPLFPTPIPLGLVLILVGATLLAGESIFLQGWIRRWRRGNARIDQRLRNVHGRVPGFIARVIELTDPHLTPGE